MPSHWPVCAAIAFLIGSVFGLWFYPDRKDMFIGFVVMFALSFHAFLFILSSPL